MNFKTILRNHLLAKKPKYSVIRYDYAALIYGVIFSFLTDKKKKKQESQDEMRSAILFTFILAYNSGVKDGGQGKPDKKWIKKRIDEELVFILLLFAELETLREGGAFVAETIAQVRADRYTLTLDGVYNQGKVTGAEDLLLTFLGKHGKPPEFPCKECDFWYGKTRPASFWVENNLIPGQPGNPNFTCGGWRCMHTLEDENGVQFLW